MGWSPLPFKAERDEIGTALWSDVCVIVVGMQDRGGGFSCVGRSGITLSRDGRGRWAFTLSQRTLVCVGEGCFVKAG